MVWFSCLPLLQGLSSPYFLRRIALCRVIFFLSSVVLGMDDVGAWKHPEVHKGHSYQEMLCFFGKTNGIQTEKFMDPYGFKEFSLLKDSVHEALSTV